MELMAVIRALKMITQPAQQIDVYSDSRYVVDAVEKGWLAGWVKQDFKKKKNKDLWKEYLNLAQAHQVRLHWVRGHTGVRENETCDQNAETAARHALQNPELAQVDGGYEANS